MPLVGRDAELAELLDAARRVPTAGLVAVVVTGEAGIGRSRLLAEAVDRLRVAGWRVLAVPGDRLERQIPYGTLVAALRGYRPDSAYAESLRGAALAALETAADAEPAAAFARGCAAMTTLLTALSAAGPLALVADDLADLDEDCLALLTVVLRRVAAAPLALLASTRSHLARPSPAADELLARLTEGADLVRVELAALPPDRLADLVAPVLGGRPDGDLAAHLHRRADGNPFFAIEIARWLTDSGALAHGADFQPVPLDRGLRSAAPAGGTGGDAVRLAVPPDRIQLGRRDDVLRRVVPPGPASRAVAQALAVLRVVELARLDLVAEVARRPAPAVAAAFDELVRAAVVVRDGQGRYRFAHAIVADALYDDIGPAQRRQVHARAARPLLAARARGEPVDLLELARHVAESASPGDAAAVAVLTDAARSALTGAPEAAAGLCVRALALLGPGAPERAALLSLRCRALARASRPDEAVACGRAALDLLAPGEDRRRTGTAVISSLFLLDRIEEAIEVADELIADAGTAPLLAQRALMLAFAGRTADAAEQGERVLLDAPAPASPAEEVVVCGQLEMLTSMLGRHDRTVALGDRALRAAGGSATLRLQALAVSASTEALAGLVEAATGRLRAADETTGGLFAGEFALARVVLDWLGGRWDAALEALRTAGVEPAGRRQATLAGALDAVELDVRTWRGELTVAAALAGRPAPRLLNIADLHAWALAGYQAAAGDAAAATATLRDQLGRADDSPYRCLLLSRLIDVQPDLEPEGEAALEEIARTTVNPWARTVACRALGQVRADPALARAAGGHAQAGGLAVERARAQLLLGELDEREVAALVDAYRLFARLGAHAARRRAGRRLQELGAKVPRMRRGGAGLLTESEERVARLVQQGMRNREIAAALNYSPRSVEVYLTRVYAKLRVASRLELARTLDAMDTAG